MTTDPLNELLGGLAKSDFSFKLLGTTDAAEVGAIATALGITTPSDALEIDFDVNLAPFLSLEWFFQVGDLDIQIKEIADDGSSEVIFAANAGIYTYSGSPGKTTELPVSFSSSDTDDSLGMTVGTYEITLTPYLSDASVKPSAMQLSTAFDTLLQTKLADGLTDILLHFPLPEYAKTPPDYLPAFTPSILEQQIELNKATLWYQLTP
jgi:hypothetical protein